MKKIIVNSISIFSLMFVAFYLNSCVKDNVTRTHTYSYYLPMYKTPAQVRANIKSSSPQDVVNPGKIVILGNYIFLNEMDKGIHVIDNRNPASPRNIAFIDIPRNLDLAIKGNTLYADLYTDLVTLDVSNPLNAIVKKYNEGVFPFRYYGNGFYNDSAKIITDWIKHDTTITQKIDGGNSPIYPQVYYMNVSTPSSSGSTNNSSRLFA
jgi:hypothetical protein